LNQRRAFGNNIPSIGGAWGGFLVELKKRPSRFEEGVSLQ